ncbi:MAG: NAD(P)-dependent oxidoreductase [Gammaproteobacteria bacterium]|nr:NAD(P)-dependent oxidoreductase [Gammaproteobacteria bacterium]
MRIAFFGAGLMGRPMIVMLLDAGHQVTVYNRTREKAEALRESGAQVADTAAEALRDCACAILMLSDAAAIREVLLRGNARAALAGGTVIQMGTIAPTHSRELHREIVAAGAEYLEAPVLGSTPEAAAARLIVMVGGTAQQFQRWSELLQCFGPAPRLIGPVGQAAALKLALNQLIASLTAAFSLSLGFVAREGLEVETFMDILRHSALYAPTFDKKLERMLKRDFADPNFPARHMLKDVNLFLEEGRRLGIATAGLEGVRALLDAGLKQGLGDGDYSGLYQVIDPSAGEAV